MTLLGWISTAGAGGGWVGGWALLMDLLQGQGGPLSYATRPPKEQGAAGDLRDPGAPPASDLVLAPMSLSPGGVS